MDQIFENHFCTHYPEIFPSSGNETAPYFGFECRNGWFELLDATCTLIQKHQQDTLCAPVIATQVKEKFGTLRFYHRGGDDYIGRLIDLAEYLSDSICDVCGKPGQTLERNKWLRTRCPSHAVEPGQPATTVAAPTESPSQLAVVIAAALHLFDLDAAAAARWLTNTNSALSQSPLAEAISAGNYQQVVTLIGQIEHGVGR